MPLNFKEMLDIAKEFVENAGEQTQGQVYGRDRRDGQGPSSGHVAGGFNRDRKFGKDGKTEAVEMLTKKLLEGHRFRGKEFCFNYNIKDSQGKSKCVDRRCPRAHNCGFIPRGASRPSGKPHSKFEHFSKN